MAFPAPLRRAKARAKQALKKIRHEWYIRRMSKADREKRYLEQLVGPIGFWDELERYQLNFLKTMGLQPRHSLLDIGCGPLQGGIPLIRYLEKQRYVGVDICLERLAVAHRRVAEHDLAAKNPLLLHSESYGRDEIAGRTFDFIWTSQLLYHLDTGLLDEFLAAIASFAGPDTVFFGDVLTDDPAHTWLEEDSTWSGYRYHFHTADEVARFAEPHGLTAQNLGPLEQHGYPTQVSLRTNHMLRITRIR